MKQALERAQEMQAKLGELRAELVYGEGVVVATYAIFFNGICAGNDLHKLRIPVVIGVWCRD